MKTKTTSTNHKWTQVQKDYWKDEATGLVWGPVLGQFTYDECVDLDLIKNMPSKNQILEAYAHDALEVLPDALGRFWTASVYSDLRTYAWFFYADYYGYMNLYNDYRGNNFSVRCVGR